MTASPNLAITHIAASENQKEVRANAAFNLIDAALTETLTANLAAASAAPTQDQVRAVTRILGASATTPGRTVTLPTVRRFVILQADSANTSPISFVRGSSTLTLAADEASIVYLDGTANGLKVIAGTGSAASGGITASGLTQATARILGRTTAGTGAIEELAATKGLVLEAGELKARFCYGWALSDEGSELVAGTAVVIDYVPHDMVVEEVIIGLAVQSTSGPVAVDVNYNGSSIFSTNPSIDQSENTNLTGTPGTFATTSLAKGGRLGFDIDASGTGAKGLKLWLRGTWA